MHRTIMLLAIVCLSTSRVSYTAEKENEQNKKSHIPVLQEPQQSSISPRELFARAAYYQWHTRDVPVGAHERALATERALTEYRRYIRKEYEQLQAEHERTEQLATPVKEGQSLLVNQQLTLHKPAQPDGDKS